MYNRIIYHKVYLYLHMNISYDKMIDHLLRSNRLSRSTSDHSRVVNTLRLDGPHPLRMARMASTHFDHGKRTETTPDPRPAASANGALESLHLKDIKGQTDIQQVCIGNA